VSFLSESSKLFFDEVRVELRRCNRRVPDFDAHCAKKHGFFASIRSGSLQWELPSEESGADLAVLDELPDMAAVQC